MRMAAEIALDEDTLPINDRIMTIWEYEEAKKKLKTQQKIIRKLKPGSRAFQKELPAFLESLIAVKGHAWCMDVASERKKIVRLITCHLFPRRQNNNLSLTTAAD